MLEALQEILNSNKEALASKHFRAWLAASDRKEVNTVLLSGKSICGVPASVATHQWKAIQKLRKKAPELLTEPCLLFPPNYYLEQTSSKQSCLAKQLILKQLNIQSLVDITGGFGLDAIYLSPHVSYTHVEHQEHLQKMAAHNFAMLNLSIPSVATDGLEYVKNHSTETDWVYADPQRRDSANQRSFHLEDHQPRPVDVIELAEQKSVAGVLFKLSPMVDLQLLLNQKTTSYHSAVVVVEVKQEVKEILWILAKKKLNFTIQYIHIDGENQQHSVAYSSYPPKNGTTQKVTDIPKMLFVPNPGLVKSGLAQAVSQDLSLKAVDDSGKIFGSNHTVNTSFYRQFTTLEPLPTNTNALRKSLDGKEFHVISFHPKIKAEIIAKKLKLVPKGTRYIIFWIQQEKSVAWLAEREITANEKS